MRDVQLVIPAGIQTFFRETIHESGGNEVLFLARVNWDESGETATVDEIEVAARGNRISVPAIIERADDWDLAIHNHPSGVLQPSDADSHVAHELGNRSVGFAIIDNLAENHYLVVPPFRQDKRRYVDPNEVEWILGPEGPLAKSLEGYEVRQGQIEMALEVARSLNENSVVSCEAGTGVGKSFAYLVPAILWATGNRERIVVSTGTIHLQEQLVNKDLPFLEKALDIGFTYAIAKGRNNYACRRKISELDDEFKIAPPDPQEKHELEELVEWAKTSEEGSLAALSAAPKPEVWDRVMSETDRSLKVQCKFYQECFYYESRRKAQRAHLLVVNHHLFFSDLAVRRETGNYHNDLVLPGYGRVIFDEAHHLEDTCAEHFSIRFSRGGVMRRIRRMCSRDGRRGRLNVISGKIRNGDAAAADTFDRSYRNMVPEIDGRLEEHFLDIEAVLDAERHGQQAGGNSDNLRVRLKPENRDDPLWGGLREQLRQIRAELAGLGALNDRAIGIIERSTLADEARASSKLEIVSFGNRLEGLMEGIDRFCDLDDAQLVRWIDLAMGRGRKRSVGFTAAPIRVADQLSTSLLQPVKSIVMTSATLSVSGKSSFLDDRLGLSLIEGDRYSYSGFESPFDFERQVLTVVPSDGAPPGGGAFEAELPERVFELVRATRGRAFVLFTSYALLRRVYEKLERRLRDLGIRPLAQGDAQRSELLERFRQADSVLFGTDSFWEGVDVKGKALECVIITRLPFRVPTDPLNEARLEEIEARGLNPFSHFTVPQAVLRFKQGFGRLIRSASDRGVVAVLDNRLLTKYYGKTFIRSLPPTKLFAGSFPECVSVVQSFFTAPEDVADEEVDEGFGAQEDSTLPR